MRRSFAALAAAWAAAMLLAVAGCGGSDEPPAITLPPGLQSLPIVNPGFDATAAGQVAGWTQVEHNRGNSYSFVADTSVYARSAPTSLRINQHGIEFFGLIEQRVRVQPDWAGKTVRLSGFVRTRGANGVGAALVLQARDGGDQILAFDQMDGRRVRGDQEWQQVAVQLKLPAGTWWLQVGAMLEDQGTLWVDDLALELMD